MRSLHPPRNNTSSPSTLNFNIAFPPTDEALLIAMSPNKANAGALSPLDAAEQLYQTGLHHLYEPTQLTFLKNIYGGLLFGFAGLFSLIAAAGVPSLEKSNPGLPKLLQGATFPVGLVIVYFVGAELFTGYPMWLAMTALRKKGDPLQYAKSLVVSWVGNLVGTLVSAFFFSYLTTSLHEEPFRSGPIKQVTGDIVEAPWHVIFLKAIGCGFLVCRSLYACVFLCYIGPIGNPKELPLSRSFHLTVLSTLHR